MHIKNNMHLVGNSDSSDVRSMQSSFQRFASGGQSFKNDGNLHFDQSKFKRKSGIPETYISRRNDRRDSMVSDSSAESDLSNDAYVNLISTNWGDEEGELR